MNFSPKLDFDAATDQRRPLRRALTENQQFGERQTAGRFYPIACVALEITQRCNLDCTLCYLSDAAEMAHDVPLPILFRRIAQIARDYGPGASVQITGGDPTLRSVEDLQALCREIRKHGMRSCLMTNGIKAKRELLKDLAAAGLDDVAFHVDLTQERRGYATEVALNSIRTEYIQRAKGLGVRVLFNTTIFAGNVDELPALARFFRSRAAEVTLASFQVQAATGRGVLRERSDAITLSGLQAAISAGVGAPVDFDAAYVGHQDCNRYASVLVAGDRAASLVGDKGLVSDVFAAMERAERRRDGYIDILRTAIRAAVRNPRLAVRVLGHMLDRVWRIRGGFWRSRFRAHRLGFLIHNFMDAQNLDRGRCESCVFTVATEDGPLSMCVHNAERDRHIFAPALMETPDGPRFWSAASGGLTSEPGQPDVEDIPYKRLKGRLKASARAPVSQTSGRVN